MKQTASLLSEKWKWNIIATIGGVLLGAGLADCLFALNELDLNQIARGLTIFSAGLTILVVMDNTKTQKISEGIQQENQQRLQSMEIQLQDIQRSQQQTEKQLLELKELLSKSAEKEKQPEQDKQS
ncbi:hypothetical protein ACFP56_11360 [Paenibacillus septentrionalis]|uniref:Holin n=1 Tax=Paenibacillus septentrionalis TaxID=429342 RepID=A0ABW1V437_9BACL